MSGGDPKVVLVTGASSGIGRACTDVLRAAGHVVVATSRNAGGGLVRLDVTSDSEVDGAVAQIVAEHGRIDVLVNNAGYALAGAVEDTTIAEAQRLFETNFFGILRLCRAVLPHMRAQKAGIIINVSSIGGAIGLPFQGLYSATKFALEGLTESLSLEVGPFGIRAVLVQPGDVATRITDNRVRCAAAGSGSPYERAFHTALGIIEEEERGGVPPEQVATLVARLVHKRAPALRYSVGKWSQRSSVLAKRILPSSIFGKSLKSYYGL